MEAITDSPTPGLVSAVFRSSEQVYSLKSVPNGWVRIRRLSYGARLQRLQLGSTLRTSIKQGGREANEEIPAEIQSALRETTYLDFKFCVVDHNLGSGDSPPRQLNFANTFDVDALDPAVGEEISELIDKHNGPMVEGDDQGNS